LKKNNPSLVPCEHSQKNIFQLGQLSEATVASDSYTSWKKYKNVPFWVRIASPQQNWGLTLQKISLANSLANIATKIWI
jgi:hypothetical protein